MACDMSQDNPSVTLTSTGFGRDAVWKLELRIVSLVT